MGRRGLAAELRAWMKSRRRMFRPVEASEALGLPPGRERERLANALIDFWRRGEAERVLKGGRVYYRYNRAYGPKKERPERKKIVKAIYLFRRAPFSSTEVLKRAYDGDRKKANYTQQVIRDLARAGFLEAVEKRKRAHAHGLETVYRIVDPEAFRVGAMD